MPLKNAEPRCRAALPDFHRVLHVGSEGLEAMKRHDRRTARDCKKSKLLIWSAWIEWRNRVNVDEAEHGRRHVRNVFEPGPDTAEHYVELLADLDGNAAVPLIAR